MDKPVKVIQFTMMVEITEDSGHPEEWDWFSLIDGTPGVAGFSFIHSETRPYTCMEDDPSTHVKH